VYNAQDSVTPRYVLLPDKTDQVKKGFDTTQPFVVLKDVNKCPGGDLAYDVTELLPVEIQDDGQLDSMFDAQKRWCSRVFYELSY